MNDQDMRRLVTDCLADIAPEADIAALAMADDLRQALDLDSMDFLNLMIALSAATGKEIPEQDYPRLFTLAGMARYFVAAP